MVSFLLCLDLFFRGFLWWRRRCELQNLKLSLLTIQWLGEILGSFLHVFNDSAEKFLSVLLRGISILIGWMSNKHTLDGRLITNRLVLENPNKSRRSSGLILSGGVSVIPRTKTGSVGGIALNKPRKVVITASLSV